MIKSILIGSVAAIAISSSVFAADAVYEAPAEPPVAVETAPQFSWSGGYAGILTGYGWGDGDFFDGTTAANDDFDGARIGGFVGYNWGVGSNAIVGLEGDVNYDWNHNDYGVGEVGTGLNGSVRARLGYAMDRVLLYTAGGYTATNFKVEGSGIDESTTLHGWTVGAGVDYALTDRVFTRLEYRYNDFSDKEVLGVDTDFDQHVVNIGLAVKF